MSQTVSALGSLLLQPQAIRRAQKIADDKALLDELLVLVEQIVLSPAQAQALAPAFAAAVDEFLVQQQALLGPKLAAAMAELASIVAPLRDGADALLAKAGNLDTVAEVADLLGGVLDAVLALLKSLTQAQLSDLVVRVTHLLGTTLGFSQSLLHEQLRGLFAAMRRHLQAGTGLSSEQGAATRHACVALIGRIEREILPLLPVVPVDSNSIAQALLGALREAGIEKIRAQAQGVIDKARAALGAATTLVDLVKPSPFGAGSVGAAQVRPPLSSDSYCWYATWLLANGSEEPKGGEVWIGGEGTQLVLRRAGEEDLLLHEDASGELRWFDAPMFKAGSGQQRYTFRRAEAETMEKWARVLWWTTTLGKAGCHLIDCVSSPREKAGNIPMVVWHALNMAFGIAKAPLPSLLVAASGWGQRGHWLYGLIPVLAVGLGSLEGRQTKASGGSCFAQWLTMLGGDAMNAYTYDSVPTQLRDVLLGLLTLRNYSAPDADKPLPRNLESAAVFASLGAFGVNYLFFLVAVPRKHYGLPWPITGSGMPWVWWLLAIITGAVGDLLGNLLGWGLAGSLDWEGYRSRLAKSLAINSATLPLLWYSVLEGSTRGGTYHPGEKQFTGYPDHKTSPYRLPYAKGSSAYVGQANAGLFSHNALGALPQVYAYDFAHDAGDAVLAVRDGVVVDYFDWVENDVRPKTAADCQKAKDLALADPAFAAGKQTSWTTWNFIVIKHTALDADHDKGLDGVASTTYAVYGHGRQNGVRESFAERGVPLLLGTTVVKRGDAIMKAGNTGRSFHNHLHLQVQVLKPGATDASVPVADHLDAYTIPFVFGEVAYLIGTDGVLKARNWFTSDNGPP